MDLNKGMRIDVTVSYVRAGDRPDNSWAGDDYESGGCGKRDKGYGCTARPGHTGDHIACGSSGRICHTWAQAEQLADWERELLAPGNEYEPNVRQQCQDTGYGSDGYICTARKGHAHAHMGWWAPGERDDDATWPQR